MGGFHVHWIVLMVVCAVALLWSWKKYRGGASWARPVAVISGILVLVFAALNLFAGGGGPNLKKNRKIQRGYATVMTEKMGRYLADTFSARRALIIAKPKGLDGTRSDGVQTLINGLKKGFGSAVSVTVDSPDVPERVLQKYPKRPPGMPAGSQNAIAEAWGPAEVPTSGVDMARKEWFTAEKVSALLDRYADKVGIVVSIIGLPENAGKMALWQMDEAERPKFALFAHSRRLKRWRDALDKGMISAVVTMKPDAKFEQKKPPSDLDKAFDKRFLLVTPENLDNVVSEYSKTFGSTE